MGRKGVFVKNSYFRFCESLRCLNYRLTVISTIISHKKSVFLFLGSFSNLYFHPYLSLNFYIYMSNSLIIDIFYQKLQFYLLQFYTVIICLNHVLKIPVLIVFLLISYLFWRHSRYPIGDFLVVFRFILLASWCFDYVPISPYYSVFPSLLYLVYPVYL